MKTLVLDIYGVIIEESKGNFTPYVYSRFPETDRARYRALFDQASRGVIDSEGFLRALGFCDVEAVKRDYIEKHSTLDPGFVPFAREFCGAFDFVLLSNDVLAWSEYLREFYDIGQYFSRAVISAAVGYRKPEREIFACALEQVGVAAGECLFVDNSAANVRAALTMGMEAVLFDRDGEAYEGKKVADFAELAQVLRG